jgi:hypothetical protein
LEREEKIWSWVLVSEGKKSENNFCREEFFFLTQKLTSFWNIEVKLAGGKKFLRLEAI